MRSPLQKFDWNGDWSRKSKKLAETNLTYPDDENVFWMSYEDCIQRFTCLNVCKAVNMDEIRMKGKFLRIQDIEDPTHEIVISKWYYCLEVEKKTKTFIGLHQEDERQLGILSRKPYLDIGIAVLRQTNEGLQLVDLRDF